MDYLTITTTDLPSTITHISKHQGLISDSAIYNFEIYVHIISFTVMAIFGIMANVVNLTVYFKYGFKDSITIGFFALSISDLAVAGTPLFTAMCYLTTKIAPDTIIDPITLHYAVASWVRQMMYSVSCTITAFLSLERCYCVVFPLKVKFIFTKKRTFIVIVLVYLAHVLVYVPVFATQKLQWKMDPVTNSTRLGLVLLPHRAGFEDFTQSVASIYLPMVTQVIVTVSAIAMANGLKKASKFRNKATSMGLSNKATLSNLGKDTKMSQNKQEHQPNMDARGGQHDTLSKEDQEYTATTKSGLSTKDSRLVQMMIILVIILTASNVPFIMLMYARRFIRGMAIGGTYMNLYSMCDSIVYLLATTNASVNVIVYYKINARFRRTVLETFCCFVCKCKKS